ncbi:hypothetical protein [Roseateles sp. LKC17W]|uniref:Uncharacterized protein n=1 Tax=Pelomonas margarita TaxID=3299031 RepID=A0ABW7FFM3_9BURK
MPSKSRNVLFAVGAVLIAATSFGATYYYISSNEIAEELKRVAGGECKRFYQREAMQGFVNVETADAWKKDGKIVVELEAREIAGSSSYVRRLCVVDEGSIMIPSLRHEGRFEK